MSAAQMPGGERHELRPTRHPPQRGARMVRIGERVEFVSRDQPKKLTEDRAMIGQGLVPRCGSMVSRNSIVPSYERTKPLLLQSLWDSSDSDPDFTYSDPDFTQFGHPPAEGRLAHPNACCRLADASGL